MGEYEQNEHTGVFASVRRLCDNGLALLQNRIELVSVEVKEEKERLIRLLALAAVVVFLANMFVIMLTATIVFLAGPHTRGPLLICLTLLYLAGAIAAYLELRKKLRSGPMPFNETISEFKKDRDWLNSPK